MQLVYTVPIRSGDPHPILLTSASSVERSVLLRKRRENGVRGWCGLGDGCSSRDT